MTLSATSVKGLSVTKDTSGRDIKVGMDVTFVSVSRPFVVVRRMESSPQTAFQSIAVSATRALVADQCMQKLVWTVRFAVPE